jgi:transcriptional regulator with XRE-family HTH domain
MSAARWSSVGFMMPLSLQTANPNVKAEVCSRSNEIQHALPHTANMSEERNYLRQWREWARLSQDELASKAGTTKSVISLLENEKRPLSSKWLRLFAEILGTRPGYILDIDPTEMDKDVFEIWMNLSTEDRTQALRILKTFKTGTHD